MNKTIFGDLYEFDGNAQHVPESQPRHEIRVMLRYGHHDFIIGAKPRRFIPILHQRIAHEINRLGTVAGENDLPKAFGTDKPGNLLMRLPVHVRCRISSLVGRTIDGCIVSGIESLYRTQNLDRFLGGCGIIKIDDRPPRMRLVEKWKITPDF